MAKRACDPQREQFWRETLTRFRNSGLSVRAFCRQEQLRESLFYAWRRTIAVRDGQPLPTGNRAAIRQRSLSHCATKRPAFVPLVMRDQSLALPTPGLAIELRGGRTLRMPDGMPVERLVAIVQALEVCEVRP